MRALCYPVGLVGSLLHRSFRWPIDVRRPLCQSTRDHLRFPRIRLSRAVSPADLGITVSPVEATGSGLLVGGARQQIFV